MYISAYLCSLSERCLLLPPPLPRPFSDERGGLGNYDDPRLLVWRCPGGAEVAALAHLWSVAPGGQWGEPGPHGRCSGGACGWGRTALALPEPGSLHELKPGEGLGRAEQLAFEGHPKLLGFFPFFLFFFSLPLPPFFSPLSAVSSSSITQTPNTSEEAVQLNLSRLQLAPE